MFAELGFLWFWSLLEFCWLWLELHDAWELSACPLDALIPLELLELEKNPVFCPDIFWWGETGSDFQEATDYQFAAAAFILRTIDE